MAATFTDEGLVLRRRAYGDADRILVVLTREHGKVSVMARGSRRAKAHNASGLDLLTRSSFLLVHGRGMEQLSQARPLGRPWPSQDLIRTTCGAVLAEIVDAMVEEGHPDGEVYQLVCEAREEMADPRSDCRAELALIAYRLATHGGYRPELQACAVCGEPLKDRDGAFSPPLGGVVQGACLAGLAQGLPCGAPTLRVLRRLADQDYRTVRRVRWTPTIRDQLEACLLAHLEHHLDRPMKAGRVLRELRNLPELAIRAQPESQERAADPDGGASGRRSGENSVG